MVTDKMRQIRSFLRQGAVQSLQTCSNVLLTIAHPDDESMFFAPTLHYLHNNGANIYVLCLSNGNGDWLGKVREKELLAACRVLQIPECRVSLVDDPHLQDGMSISWSSKAVAQHVEQHLRRHPCDTVLTFDAHGVSGHLNHQGLHHGVRLLLEQKGRSLGVQQAWQLPAKATASCRKVASAVTGRKRLAEQPGYAVPLSHCRYRKLFVLLSSYTYVNRLQLMVVG